MSNHNKALIDFVTKVRGEIMSKHKLVQKAKLIDRPNRFLARVEVDGQIVETFVPNPGRMNEFMIPGKQVFIRNNPAPHRKTSYDMMGVDHDGVIVSIDSNLPNRFIRRLLENHELPYLSDYDDVVSEPRVYDGRFDFRLVGTKTSLVEVKSCTLVEGGHALFPDAPTIRGARHMRHLARALTEDIAQHAAVIFVIQRPDAHIFSPHDGNDPLFGDSLRSAFLLGVDVIPLVTEVVNWDLKLVDRIPFDLGPLRRFVIK
ncbi:DNA/RNA nuclease SfsA [Candidatus Thorarchaeota archaeon]|nr:MAG: DNA/RNA nuclease SfsA [Candidatus Thorarchaeota archaeon]